jgi:hypothetical protein
MKRPETVVRLFKKEDEEMLQQSDVLMDSFETHKEVFVFRFPQLGGTFGADWAADTAAARAILPDYAEVGEQANETSKLEELMEQGRELFQTTMFYAGLAFPDSPEILHMFGSAEYHPARSNQLKLPTLLRTIHAQVSKPEYQAPLIEKGLKQTDIDLLETLAQDIVTQNIVQQNAMKARALATNQRILAMNKVWERMALVCQCAKLVFQDDAARYNLFLLTDEETPKEVEAPVPAAAN